MVTVCTEPQKERSKCQRDINIGFFFVVIAHMKDMQGIRTSFRELHVYLIHSAEMVQEEMRLELVGLCRVQTKQCQDICIKFLQNKGS
jgi:hypothetical protein